MTSSMIISIITSNWVIGIASGAIAVALYKWLQPKNEDWHHWIGLALQAVKVAEKSIPPNTKNKSLAKFDYAMESFTDKWEKLTGKEIDVSELAEVQNLIEEAVQMISKPKAQNHEKIVKKNH